MAIELYTNANGEMRASFVSCGRCNFDSVNVALIYCPNDGSVLGESTAPYVFVAGEVTRALAAGATLLP